MSIKWTKAELQKKIDEGKVKVDKEQLTGGTSLFSEKEMIKTIKDDDIKKVAEKVSSLERDVLNTRAIWVPGNVPSSKNNYQIVIFPKNISTCCKEPVFKPKDSKIYICSRCNKVANRVETRTIAAGKTIVKYKKETLKYWQELGQVFKFMTRNMTPPYYVGFYFVRSSRRIFDYINAAQVIQDIMGNGIKQQKLIISEPWMEDDDTDNINPLFLGTHVDSNAPGIYIRPVGELVGHFFKLITNPAEFDMTLLTEQINDFKKEYDEDI